VQLGLLQGPAFDGEDIRLRCRLVAANSLCADRYIDRGFGEIGNDFSFHHTGTRGEQAEARRQHHPRPRIRQRGEIMTGARMARNIGTIR